MSNIITYDILSSVFKVAIVEKFDCISKFSKGCDAPESQQKVVLVVRYESWALGVEGGGGVLPQILDRGVPRRFLNPNPI